VISDKPQRKALKRPDFWHTSGLSELKNPPDFPCKSTPYPKLSNPSKGIRFYPQAILEIPLKNLPKPAR